MRATVLVLLCALVASCSTVSPQQDGEVLGGLPPAAVPASVPASASANAPEDAPDDAPDDAPGDAPDGAPGTLPPDDAPALEDHRAQVGALLDAVALAFRAGDPELLRPLLHDPESAFGQRWLARAEHIARVPLAGYTLAPDPSLADLTTAEHPGDGALLVNVLERHGLRGAESLADLEARLYLTLRQRDGRWTVASDRDGRVLGLSSAVHLWDLGPVAVSGSGDVLVLHAPDQAGVDTLVAETLVALERARQRWPLAWPGEAVLLVPGDEQQLGELLNVTFDLSNFIAFATATPSGTLGRGQLSGSRMLVNTERFLTRGSEVRRSILTHELVHVATRPSSSGLLPSWLEEGVAQVVGEQRSTTGTGTVDRLPADELVLPADHDFTTGDRDDTFRAYQLSWAFADWLVRERGGVDALAQFYRAAGRDAQQQPGTRAARVDAASRLVYGSDVEGLVAAWRVAR